MENEIIITSAAISKSRKLFSVVDIELYDNDESNGAIIEIINNKAEERIISDEQIINFFIGCDKNSLYVLTASNIFFYNDKKKKTVFSNLDFGLYKKFWKNEKSIYLLTTQDILIEIELTNYIYKIISLEIDASISIENAIIDELGIKYLVGWQGLILERDKQDWKTIETPTNLILSSIALINKNTTLAVGLEGIIVSNKDDTSIIIKHDWRGYNFWDIIKFNEKIYILGEGGVFNLINSNSIEPVIGRPQNGGMFFKFISNGDILWAVGEKNILEFDGNSWKDVITLT